MGWRKPKPFQCTICGRDFKKESQLKRHIKDAHDVDYKQYVKDMEEANVNSRAN